MCEIGLLGRFLNRAVFNYLGMENENVYSFLLVIQIFSNFFYFYYDCGYYDIIINNRDVSSFCKVHLNIADTIFNNLIQMFLFYSNFTHILTCRYDSRYQIIQTSGTIQKFKFESHKRYFVC